MGVEFGLANCTTKRQWTIDESHSRTLISLVEMRTRMRPMKLVSVAFRSAKGHPFAERKVPQKMVRPIPIGYTNENRPAITYSARASTKTFRH